jgi:triphosphoribosyl-dephospho-CoA synthetase
VAVSSATAKTAQAEYNAVILVHKGREKPAVEARKDAREKLRQAKKQVRWSERECREAIRHRERVRLLSDKFKDMENKMGVWVD